MYEYATIAILDKYSGASFDVTKIAVGPSAPPIIPIADAILASKFVQPKPFLPKLIAPIKVIKIPIWAAAPSNIVFLLAISGPKSVVAPIHKKIKQGYKISFSVRKS